MHRGGSISLPAHGQSGAAQKSLAKLRGALSVRSSTAPLVGLGLLVLLVVMIGAGRSYIGGDVRHEPGPASQETATGAAQSAPSGSIEDDSKAQASSGEVASAREVTVAAEGQARAAEPGSEGQARAAEAGGNAGDGLDPSRPSKCSEACFARGSCNEETGECVCLASYEGVDCERDALPACEVAPGYRSPCAHMSTCACTLQCQRLFLPIFWPHCLPSEDASGQRITNLSQLYEGPMQVLPWAPGGLTFLPVFPATNLDHKAYVVDPTLCKDMCSGRGACIRDGHFCICSWATGGPACEESPAQMTVPCFNSCSGRGTCVLGACQCQRGFFGLDCSLFVDPSGKTRVLQRPPYNWAPEVPWPALTGAELRPRIYVYELPPQFNAWDGAHAGMHLDYPGQAFLLERMLNNPYRTADPEEADFFYLPLVLRHRGDNKANTLEQAMYYIQGRWPYFNRSGGADHFFFTNDDWGNCDIGGQSPYGEFAGPVASMSTITLWGCTRNMHMEEQNPCFRPGRDIKVPMVQTGGPYTVAPLFTGKVTDPQERSILLYFRGSSFKDITEPFGRGWFTHSFGVRQEVFKLYQGRFNVTGILLDGMGGVPPDWHLRQFLKSKFCLIAAGYGMGPRGPQAILMGCIPVVIQPHTHQAFQGDGLDWNEFAVLLTKEDVPRLEQILRAIPEEEVERKRRAMARVQMRFIWTSTNRNPIPELPQEDQARHAAALVKSDVFASIMQAMRSRLEKAGKL